MPETPSVLYIVTDMLFVQPIVTRLQRALWTDLLYADRTLAFSTRDVKRCQNPDRDWQVMEFAGHVIVELGEPLWTPQEGTT